MKKLVAGQQVKTAYDKYSPLITIMTTANYLSEMHKDADGNWDINKWKAWEEECGRNWKQQYLWSNKSGACICGNYPGKAHEHKQKAWAYEAATLLEDGEIVWCEGFKFLVTVIKRDVSDPIHFTLID